MGRYTLGHPLAVEPKTSPSSVKPRPHELLLVLRMSSSFEPSGLNRKIPCPNRIASPPTVPWNAEYPTIPQTQLSSPQRRLLGPACVSAIPHPEKSTLRRSARPSPSVSFKNNVSGAWSTITPPLQVRRLVGILSPSAKTLNESARPSPSASSQMVIRSCPGPSRRFEFG